MRTRRFLVSAAATAAAFVLTAPGASAQMTLVGDYPGSFPGARLGTTAPGVVVIDSQPTPTAVGAPSTLAPAAGGYAPAGQAGTVLINTQPGFSLAGPAPAAPAYRPGGPVLYSSTAAYRQSAPAYATPNPAYRPAPTQPTYGVGMQPYPPRLYSTVRPSGNRR